MGISVIKLLLIIAIAVLALLAFRGARGAAYQLLWRGYGVLVGVAAILGVLFPEALTRMAKAVGVGRGADLVLYVLVVTFMITSVILFRRLAELERRYVRVVRSLAIANAAPPTRDETP